MRLGIVRHDREVRVLIDGVEAEAEPEAVGERQAVVDLAGRNGKRL